MFLFFTWGEIFPWLGWRLFSFVFRRDVQRSLYAFIFMVMSTVGGFIELYTDFPPAHSDGWGGSFQSTVDTMGISKPHIG